MKLKTTAVTLCQTGILAAFHSFEKNRFRNLVKVRENIQSDALW